MKANYHTHTRRCMHAAGSDEDYIKSAIKGGYEVLGFSDHTPWKYASDFEAHMRMPVSQLDDYVTSISKLREKYKDQIKILIGLECEYFEQYMPWLKQTILDYKLDYVILGNHYYKTDESRIYFGRSCKDEEMLNIYVDEAIKAFKTGLYSYLAHPDLFMRAYPNFDDICAFASRRLCLAAKEYDIPLEYNLCGLAYNKQMHCEEYPHHSFWEIAADVGNRCIIGVDAHDNLDLEHDDLRMEGYRYLRSLGLTVEDKIDIKDISKAIV